MSSPSPSPSRSRSRSQRLSPGAFLIFTALAGGCPGNDEETPDAGPIVEMDGGIAADGGPSDAGLAPPPEACARPAGEPSRGDINGDGVVDVADPVAFENYLFRGGPEPVCTAAADWNEDRLTELDDATAIVSYLVPGTQNIRVLEPDSCTQSSPWSEGQCGPLALELDTPARVTTDRFNATVAIRSPLLGVQGWSMSVRADGCTIVGATTEGTVAAEVWDDPPGLRHLGYAASKPVDGGAISFVILSIESEVTLPASELRQPVLLLQVQSIPPPSGCTTCVLSFADDLAWTGQPVRSVVAAGGYAYPAAPSSSSIEVCAP